jgi:hypothetical protein
MPNWNMLQNAIEKGDVDAAFILAPAAMDLFNYTVVPIKLTLFAHKKRQHHGPQQIAEYGNLSTVLQTQDVSSSLTRVDPSYAA